MGGSLRVAVDIGGTFTDAVGYDETSGTFRTGKAATTPDDLVRGVLTAVGQLTDDPSSITSFVHGTTVGLNALLQRSGERVVLLSTRGISDTYQIARGFRPEIFNIRYRRGETLVPRWDVKEIGGRLDWTGKEIEPLDEASMAAAADYIERTGVVSVAICLLFSYLNPAHEAEVARYIAERVPGVSVLASHELAQEWREYERTSTTVLSAYSGPTVRRYLARLESGLLESGVRAPLRVMQSNGGIIAAEQARAQPLQTFFSGPVGGAAGGRTLAERLGRKNLICIDMGGTSFDISLIVDGEPEILPQADIAGLPAMMSVVDIQTIGAGGGSLAYVQHGALRVGPQSAGAVPGPACYGRGGTTPTVTDANVVLGRIDPDRFLDGRMSLDPAAAARAVKEVADELGTPMTVLAEGIIEVVDAKMAQAIRAITVDRGIEPRDFTLVAFGGAGALHAAQLASELNIGEVVIPDLPGAFSAWGMLQSPVRQDFSISFFRQIEELDPQELEESFLRLEESAMRRMLAGGVPAEHIELARAVDVRYRGQEHTITVGIQSAPGLLDQLGADFTSEYRRRYGHASDGSPTESVNLRLTATAPVDFSPVAALEPEPGPPPATRAEWRDVVFARAPRRTMRIHRSDLGVGDEGEGPMIIDEPTSTTVVPPGWRLVVDGFRSLVLTQEAPHGA